MKSHRIPLLGVAVFVVLFGCAASLYPGGNQTNPHAPGFDWLHNYWCDLLGPVADNGQLNPARPVAMLAMIVLGVALAFFWYRLAGFLAGSRSRRVAVRVSGIVSMTTACLLFTPWHDIALVVSGSAVLVALAATLIFLRQNHQKQLLRLGLACMLFFVANNAIYWTKTGLAWLPILQKVTICVFLYWIARISLLLKR
ncbi:MAG: hypothetical protein ABMA02_11835 [Saprospiraceae bacterium]